MIQYVFPQDLRRYHLVSGSEQLKIILFTDSREVKLINSFKICVRKQIYLYAKCKYCSCSLVYRRNLDNLLYSLTKYSIQHSHKYQNKNSQKHAQLRLFLEELPRNVDVRTVKIIALREFKITSSQFYYHLSKVLFSSEGFTDLLKSLDGDGYSISFVNSEEEDERSNQLPDLMMITNEEMKQAYEINGSSISFDVTFNLFKQKRGSSSFKAGCFLALSGSKRITPVAFVVILNQTKQMYMHLFKIFFEVMGSQPSFIITDESISMIQALRQLKESGIFTGYHTMDTFHLLRNIRKRLNVKERILNFRDLLFAPNTQQYDKLLQSTYQRLNQKDIDVLAKFDRQKSAYCFSYLPHQFVGISCSTSPNQKFHDLLKARIPRQMHFTKVVRSSLKLISDLLIKSSLFQIERFPLQRYYFAELKLIRLNLDKRIMKEIIKELQKMVFIDVLSKDTDVVYVKDMRNSLQFTLRQLQNKWKCSCSFQEKTGLPCCHLIKICLIYHRSVLQTINRKWIVGRQSSYHHKRASTGRKTRRRAR